jgi:putative transposase
MMNLISHAYGPRFKCIVNGCLAAQTKVKWQAFLKRHNLEASMSRRENYYDNAVVENFPTYKKVSGSGGKSTLLVRKHGKNEILSPIDFELQQIVKLQGV